jgi:energy-coupling factor transporter transmembrane protein EcfT
MHTRHINRASGVVLVLLSLVALVTVATGLVWPPQTPEPDEGTQAHIFQLSIVGLLPMIVIFVGTADWRQTWRSAQPIALAFLATLLAFAGLYYLEHFR